ncbi:hypothetical protein LTR62_001269 [Meristemomyces frigidus]|uniref:Uncharacterized protein n=1 Tax=Meristemomyces frigidus TaxID=1508187 RepID=A0AAN7TBP2_9PEZI|nr:hypothetical protein LTR62_001269 [Meristemomyces frigidus]
MATLRVPPQTLPTVPRSPILADLPTDIQEEGTKWITALLLNQRVIETVAQIFAGQISKRAARSMGDGHLLSELYLLYPDDTKEPYTGQRQAAYDFLQSQQIRNLPVSISKDWWLLFKDGDGASVEELSIQYKLQLYLFGIVRPGISEVFLRSHDWAVRAGRTLPWETDASTVSWAMEDSFGGQMEWDAENLRQALVLRRARLPPFRVELDTLVKLIEQDPAIVLPLRPQKSARPGRPNLQDYPDIVAFMTKKYGRSE